MYDEDSFFIALNDPDDGRQLTALWLLAGIAWLLTLGGSALGASWVIRQTLQLG